MNNAAEHALLNFQNADFDLLAQLVENEKCALFLGPFASSALAHDGSQTSLRILLAREIAEDLRQKTGQPLPDTDNLGLVCSAYVNQPNTSRTSLEIKVRDFYRRHTEPSPLHLEVARLPFRLIFTVAPDELLQKAFLTEKKRSFREGYYRFSKTQVGDFDDTPEGWTYIYQLFGRVLEKPDGSLPLTIADQLEYIDSVQGVGKETRLPTGLRNAMQDCEAFLFLGFDYENWYLRVLFHILKFSEKTKLVFGLPEGASAQMPGATEAFFRHQFKFSFLQDRPLELLRGIHARIESGQTGREPEGGKATRSLLFLHATADEGLKDKLDRHLASVKKKHGLASGSIHDFDGGEVAATQNNKIDAATVIVVILSADFLADDELAEHLVRRALARQSPTVVIAAVYARSVDGAANLFKGKAPVFPAETIPLSMMQEEAGMPMVAGMLEKLIAAMP